MATTEQGIVLRKISEVTGYTFHWWDGKDEQYERCIEYEIVAAPSGLATGRIQVAFGTREAYGMHRRRILVFRDRNNVLVEFVGADDHEHSGLVLWLLKKAGSREDVRPDEAIPGDFQALHCVPFDSFIRGPWTRKNLAVLVHESYHPVLVEVALVRESHLRAPSQ